MTRWSAYLQRQRDGETTLAESIAPAQRPANECESVRSLAPLSGVQRRPLQIPVTRGSPATIRRSPGARFDADPESAHGADIQPLLI